MRSPIAIGCHVLLLVGCSNADEPAASGGNAGQGDAGVAGAAGQGGEGGEGGTGGGAGAAGAASRFDGIDQAIQEGLESLPRAGAAFAIIQEGEVVWSKGYGPKDPNDPRSDPVMDTTLFITAHVGGISTALRIMQLSDAGALSIDAGTPPSGRALMAMPLTSLHPNCASTTCRRDAATEHGRH